jgi:DNA-binding transcriptional MerR regulator
MRIAELSRSTGVPVPTIKYYLREGLLPPGELSSPNQATYTETHVHRLRLIRALLDVGRLSIAVIGELLAYLDQRDADPHQMLGKALAATERSKDRAEDGNLAAAEDEVVALIARRGWRIATDAPARHSVARAIAALRQLAADDLLSHIDDYADAAERIAVADLETVLHLTDRDAMVYGAVVGTIIGDSLMAGLRRLAQEDRSARAFDSVAGAGAAQGPAA